MHKILLIFSLVFLLTGAASAANMSVVKAYPVPFNPGQDGAIQIYIPDGDYSVIFTVYDINGDQVTTRSFPSTTYLAGSPTVAWNGRSSHGRIVKPGLYLIKVVVQNDATGDYGKKIIRILVKG